MLVKVTLGFLVIIVMVLLWVGALWAPSHIYEDNDANLTPLEARVLKTEAREHSEIPPVWMQITKAVSSASPSGDVSNPNLPDGVVVWRGPFGIIEGRTETRSGQVIVNSFNPWNMLFELLLLLLVEFKLMLVAIVCFVLAILRRRPKTREPASG
jgi:hypothetical protein